MSIPTAIWQFHTLYCFTLKHALYRAFELYSFCDQQMWRHLWQLLQLISVSIQQLNEIYYINSYLYLVVWQFRLGKTPVVHGFNVVTIRCGRCVLWSRGFNAMTSAADIALGRGRSNATLIGQVVSDEAGKPKKSSGG